MVTLLIHQRHAAFAILTQHLDDTNETGLKRGILADVAKKFKVDRSVICRLWRESRTIMTSQNLSIDDLLLDSSYFKPKHNSKRKGKYKFDRSELRQTVKNLPFKERKSFRDLAIKTGISKTTLHRMTKKEKVLKVHSSALKPTLTDEQKMA